MLVRVFFNIFNNILNGCLLKLEGLLKLGEIDMFFTGSHLQNDLINKYSF